MFIQLTGWTNGSDGYGLKLKMSKNVRKYFCELRAIGLRVIILELPENHRHSMTLNCKLSDSFWNQCPELRSAKIRDWMKARGDLPWYKGHPPKYKAEIERDHIQVLGYWQGNHMFR